MIKKLSDTWKQQKRTTHLRNDFNTKDVQSGYNNKEKSCTNKKQASSKTLCEWDIGDSLLENGNTPKIQRKTEKIIQSLKSPELSRNDFTRVVTRSMVSTPQLQRKHGENRPKGAESAKKAKATPSLPSPGLNKSVQLSQWGLPDVILENYKAKGISTMFEWQKECLLQENVLDGANLIYSAPTSAGKTLVAEILMLKRVLETEKKAIYILPFVSVAREKMYSLRNRFEEAGINVGGFMGNENPPGGLSSIDIAICTIERANSLINRLMEEDKLSLLGSIVIDEMHMIGDSSRGYLLELLLTKIQFLSAKKATSQTDKNNGIQIIGMSATLPNLDMMAEWLNAKYYVTEYRPVPLSEHLKSGKAIYDGKNAVVRRISDAQTIAGDDDDVINLCLETLRENNAVLIFCPTKNWCEKLSLTIATYLTDHVFNQKNNNDKGIPYDQDGLNAIINELQQTPAGLDSGLEKVVLAGVSYHHAGLTMDERDIVEGAFRRGVLRIIIATSTLSSGVNLPARRVIIRSPMFHGKTLDPLVYKQMVGRAGRKGVDTQGESILVCKPHEKQKALALMTSILKPVYSCLLAEDRSMNRALLEVIAGGVAISPPDVELYAKSTFLNTCLAVQTGRNPEELICTSMKFLLKNDFIKLHFDKNKDNEEEKPQEKYFPSQLGSATLASSMKPDEAIVVYFELQKARRNFCLENELHIVYQVTPTYMNDQWPDLDWYTYYTIWERLSSQSKRVAEMVGVKESFLARAMQNRINTSNEEQKRMLRIHRRFYAALVLQDFCNEIPIKDVSRKYKIHKGLLQSLQNSAATFAGMVTVFCRKLGWSCLEVLLEQFQSRLSFGVCRDLCNLVRIPLLNRFTARLFYQKGFQTVSSIANATEKEIIKLLRESTPFHSRKIVADGEQVGGGALQTKQQCLWLSGKEGLSEAEASRLIIEEARRILTSDAQALGIPIDQLSTKSIKMSPYGPAPDRRRKANNNTNGSGGKRSNSRGRRNRKRSSVERITPWRNSKRPSPEQENTPLRNTMSEKLENASLSSKTSSCLSKSISPLFRDIQNLPTQQYFQDDNLSNDSLFPDECFPQSHNGSIQCKETTSKQDVISDHIPPNGITMQSTTTVDCSESNIKPTKLANESDPQISASWLNDGFPSLSLPTKTERISEQPPKRKNSDDLFSDVNGVQDSLLLHQNVPTQILLPEVKNGLEEASKDKEKTEEAKDSMMDSSDSLFFLSDSAFEPRHMDPQHGDSSKKIHPQQSHIPPYLSLRLSTSEETIEEDVVPDILPPLRLQSQFNAAATFTAATSPEIELFGDNAITTSVGSNNSGELFEATLFQKRSLAATPNVSANESSSDEFLVIDVTSSKSLFQTFIQEWRLKSSFTISFSCETFKQSSSTKGSAAIGSRIGHSLRSSKFPAKTSSTSNDPKSPSRLLYTHDDLYVTGMSVCWEKKESFYIHLTEVNSLQQDLLEDTASTPTVAEDLPLKLRINGIRSVLNDHSRASVRGFNLKEQLKVFLELCDSMLPTASLQDPKVAQWLLEPSQREKNLIGIAKQWLNEDFTSLAQDSGSGSGTNGFGMVPKAGYSGRIRACVESVIVNELMSVLSLQMKKENLLKSFLEVEMPALRTLSIIEINGIGFSDQQCDKLTKIMKKKLNYLEKQCYKLAKRPFSLSSPDDVGRVLFLELSLPYNGTSAISEALAARSTRGKHSKHFRTSKDVLEKLVPFHRLPKLILEWRLINSTLTKTVYPVQRMKVKRVELRMFRVYSESQFHTCTGRVTFSEPNIQNVPKEFDVKTSQLTEDTWRNLDLNGKSPPGVIKKVSMRSTFIPYEGAVYISADYSQLELRIMAHLSGDSKLIETINRSKDIFKDIAAGVHKIAVDDVTTCQRQQAKQICYGILYGIGVKSLAEQMSTTEEEATSFVDTFKRKYRGVNLFIQKTMADCRKSGFVVTLAGRKRFLPAINSTDSHARSQAERQSVNTAVQGSAADLVKRAMHRIYAALYSKYKVCCLKRNSAEERITPPPRGAFLVLQIHDELLYEVNKKDVDAVVRIIRDGMENAYKLLVKSPVKIHTGDSWGHLTDV